MRTTRSLGPLLAAGGLAYLGWRALRPAEEADLRGQVALITGGSRGLGLLMAKELAVLGCKLVICARNEPELRRAQGELEQLGAEVLAEVCDVGVREQVETLVGNTLERFRRIDIVVNNASIIQVGPLASLTVEDMEAAMAVNFWGTVYTTFAALPAMRRQGYGRILNIDSIGGRVAVPHLLPYDCAKFATRGFSEGLRAELAVEGITVTTILPGLLRTGSPLNALFKGRRELEYLWFSAADSVPLLAMAPQRAARRIVQALRRGEAELTLSLPAKALGLLHDLFPGATMGLLALSNRMLPAADGPNAAVKGMAVDLPAEADPLRRRVDRLGEATNQFAGTKTYPGR